MKNFKLMTILFLFTLDLMAESKQVLLSCPSPFQKDIQSLEIISHDMGLTDRAWINLVTHLGERQTIAVTREDVSEGYIVLPSFDGFERVLALEEQGWFVIVMKGDSLEYSLSNCFEPNPTLFP